MSGGSSALADRWRDAAQRFAQLRPREKGLIALAVAVVVLFGGYSLWIEPAQARAAWLKTQLAQQQTDESRLQAELDALARRAGDPDAANRAALQQLRGELTTIERDIDTLGHALVPPQRIPALLQGLLARHHGLTLVSLTTLPPRPLIAPPKESADSPKKTQTAPAGGNLYQHGIEIKLSGAYPDLLAYLTELDARPQKLLKGGMRLVVRQYPVSELTLTIYTLSLDSTWLVV